MYQIFKQNKEQAKYFALFTIFIIFFLLLAVAFKNDDEIMGKKIDISFQHEDLASIKKFLLGKINSPFINVNYEIKKGDSIQKILKKFEIKNNEIILSQLDLFLSLRSFFTSNFLLKRAEIAFVKNDIKDLTKITGIFLPKFINKKLNKIFHKGNLEGEFIIPFESDGSIGKDYGFSGKVSEASINLTKEFSIKKLTTEIKHVKVADVDEFKITIKKGSIYDLELADSTINLKRKKNETKVKSLLRTKGQLNFSQIKKISTLFALNTDNLKDVNGIADLKTNINFVLNKEFKIRDLSYSMEGDIAYLEIHTEEKRIIRKYLPEFDPKIILKDTNIKLINSKSNNTVELNGFIKVKDYFDNFKIKEIYNYNEKSFDINGIIDLTNSKVKVSRLNYNKDYGKKSELNFDVNFVLDKYYNINNLNFLADKTKIHLSNIKLNKNFEVKDFKKLEIKTFKNEIKNIGGEIICKVF